MTGKSTALVLPFQPLASVKTEKQSGLFTASASRWAGREPSATEWVVDKLVPEGAVTLLSAAGGRGKSYFALQAMACVAAGVPFLGFEVKRGVAAGLFAEDDEDELHRRAKAICTSLGVTFEDVAPYLFPVSVVGHSAILWKAQKGATALLDALEADIALQPDTRLWVIDGASFTYDGPEQDRGEVTRYLSALTGIARRHSLAIVLIIHESKTVVEGSDTHSTSGSTAWLNTARSAIGIYTDKKNPSLRTLRHIKANKGPKITPLTCRFVEGGFSLLGDAQRQREAWEFAEQTIREALTRGVSLSPKPRAKNFAGAYVHQQAGGSFTLEEIKGALQHLEDFSIEVETYVDRGGEHVRYRLRGGADDGL